MFISYLNPRRNHKSTCFGKEVVDFEIYECYHLKRMLEAIKYYQSLELNVNNDLFSDFSENKYGDDDSLLLTDYQHIISNHDGQTSKW